MVELECIEEGVCCWINEFWVVGGLDEVDWCCVIVEICGGKFWFEICWIFEELGCDLIVMGIYGVIGIKYMFIGSQVECVVCWVNCYVLMVKFEGFDSNLEGIL